MSNRKIRFLGATLAMALLGACDGGSVFGDVTAVDPSVPEGTPAAASLTLFSSSPQLSSDAETTAQGVTLTAIVKDATNNVIPGQVVNFTTTSGTLVGGSNVTTDDNGQAQAVLHTAADPRNRTITVTAVSGSISRSVTVTVIGTTLTISGPDNTLFNEPTEFVIQLADGAGDGIFGETVSVTTEAGNTITSDSLTTDINGRVTVELSATQASSSISATALEITATKNIAVSTDTFRFTSPAAGAEVNIGASPTVSVQWLQGGAPVPDGTQVNFTATRGTLSATSATTTGGVATVSITSASAGFSRIVASSQALTKPTTTRSIEFVATTPDTIVLQASPSTISANQTSEIRATVRDANSNLVKNAIVNFTLNDSSGGEVLPAQATTDSLGTARVDYIASSANTGAGPGGEAATVTGIVEQTVVQGSTTVTVASTAARIAMGTGSEIIIKDESTYQLPFTVVVTNSNGNPTPNAEFSLSALPHKFYKGFFGAADGGSIAFFNRVECDNEDVNLNAREDQGEDLDGDGELEPGNVAAAPRTIQLEEDGSGQFLLTYPKEFGLFVMVRLLATAVVNGTESTEQREVLLSVAQGEVDNLPGVSPYGSDTPTGDPAVDCANRD